MNNIGPFCHSKPPREVALKEALKAIPKMEMQRSKSIAKLMADPRKLAEHKANNFRRAEDLRLQIKRDYIDLHQACQINDVELAIVDKLLSGIADIIENKLDTMIKYYPEEHYISKFLDECSQLQKKLDNKTSISDKDKTRPTRILEDFFIEHQHDPVVKKVYQDILNSIS